MERRESACRPSLFNGCLNFKENIKEIVPVVALTLQSFSNLLTMHVSPVVMHKAAQLKLSTHWPSSPAVYLHKRKEN